MCVRSHACPLCGVNAADRGRQSQSFCIAASRHFVWQLFKLYERSYSELKPHFLSRANRSSMSDVLLNRVPSNCAIVSWPAAARNPTTLGDGYVFLSCIITITPSSYIKEAKRSLDGYDFMRRDRTKFHPTLALLCSFNNFLELNND